MRRPVSLLASLVVAATTLVAPIVAAAAPVTAQPVRHTGPEQTEVQALPAGVEDFGFDSLHADFRLGRDDDGRSTLATTETFVARFPETDQNHGINRKIPTHYRGVPTGLAIDSVTDETGQERDYETDTDSDDSGAEFLTVTIVDDDFVHGDQAYVISYSQKNIAHLPGDTTDQEFFWEVNGTGWAQPFASVSATIHVAPDLVPALSGETACFQGGSTSGAACDLLDGSFAGDEWLIEATAGELGPHQGLALAVGFDGGTFVARDDSFTATPFPMIALVAALAALAAAVTAVFLRTVRWRDRAGRPTIIAEYLPPVGANLLQAGDVLGGRASGRAIAAQVLQFAVTGKIRVLEGKGKSQYLLELRTRAGLDPTERAVLDALFPANRRIGAVRDLKQKDTGLGTALHVVRTDARTRMLSDGLRERAGGALRRRLIAVAIVAGGFAFVASVVSMETEVGGGWPALFLVGGLTAAIVTLVTLATVRPLTARGAELRDYLKGVTVYISLAEADRLRVLQSPTGALRTPHRTDFSGSEFYSPDPAAGTVATETGGVLRLYERLLPIAVLSGQAKEWSRVLGDSYAGSSEQPDWYVGTAPFNAAYFATGVSGFASSTSSSSLSGSSSGSDSDGGGSVGDGGGGGGGGGE